MWAARRRQHGTHHEQLFVPSNPGTPTRAVPFPRTKVAADLVRPAELKLLMAVHPRAAQPAGGAAVTAVAWSGGGGGGGSASQRAGTRPGGHSSVGRRSVWHSGVGGGGGDGGTDRAMGVAGRRRSNGGGGLRVTVRVAARFLPP